MNLFCYGQVESPYGSGEFIRVAAEQLRRAARKAGAVGDREQGSDLRIDQEVSGKGKVIEAQSRQLDRSADAADSATTPLNHDHGHRHLRTAARRIWPTFSGRSRATRASYGLDFFPTIFEVVDSDQLNAIAAYGGFPDPLSALAVRHGVRAALARAITTGCRRSTRW